MSDLLTLRCSVHSIAYELVGDVAEITQFIAQVAGKRRMWLPTADDAAAALRDIGRPVTATDIYFKMLAHGTYERQPKDRTVRLREVMRSDPRFKRTSVSTNGLWYLVEWARPGAGGEGST